MPSSLFAGVSGVRAHQEMLDVVGNNLANLNTTGFKAQRLRFADLISDTKSPASGGVAGQIGGTNPLQVGLRVRTAAIDTELNQGSLEATSQDLDLAIQGNGFFVVNDGLRNVYTRAGAFGVDENNTLVDPATGYRVQRYGTVGDGDATTPAFQVAGDTSIQIPFGISIPGQQTASVSLKGNLTASAAIGDTVTSAIQVFDTQGTPHTLSLTFEKLANNQWNATGSIDPSEGSVIDGAVDSITFNDDGSLQGATGATMSFQINGLSAPQTVSISLGTANGFDGLTQFGGATSAAATDQDGFAAGFLTAVSVSQGGVIEGVFTNGRILPIAQIALASFTNPGGLHRLGDNYFDVSGNSGIPLVGTAVTGGRGAVRGGTLESSNVDVALEFTRLIIAQRGFQVNTRTITATDEVLQELSNIIR